MSKIDLRNPNPWIATVMLTLAILPKIGAQAIAVDTPSDVERARVKAEKAWKAWEAQGHIEPKLLSMPADRAIAQIHKDSKLADEYLTARQEQVKLLAEDFHRRAAELEAEGPPPDLNALQKSEEQNLDALVKGDMKTAADLKADKESDPGLKEAKRQAAAKESEYYKQLSDEVRKRIDSMKTTDHSDAEYAENEHMLIDTLNRLSATLDEQSADFARERDDWESYHKHLEEIVLSRGKTKASE